MEMHTHTHTNTHAHTHRGIHSFHMHTHMQVHTHTHTHSQVHRKAYTHLICTHAHTYTAEVARTLPLIVLLTPFSPHNNYKQLPNKRQLGLVILEGVGMCLSVHGYC